jgi:hypothetical protein
MAATVIINRHTGPDGAQTLIMLMIHILVLFLVLLTLFQFQQLVLIIASGVQLDCNVL